MKKENKKYEFLFLEQLGAFINSQPFDPDNQKNQDSFEERMGEHCLEGWGIVSVNYIEKDNKVYKAVTLQREILD